MQCKYCFKNNSEDDFIFETPHWKCFLTDEQTYLGRCIIALKRHAGSLSELTKEEWMEFLKIVQKFEKALSKAFNATMFNWTCLMNDAYKDKTPNPHVHFHARPRYKTKVIFCSETFEDKEFGEHYNRNKTRKVSDKVQGEIINKIKSQIS